MSINVYQNLSQCDEWEKCKYIAMCDNCKKSPCNQANNVLSIPKSLIDYSSLK